MRIGLNGLVDWIALAGVARSRSAATAYTGLLFAQGLARDLWQGPHATIDLVAQAIAEGAAVMLMAAVFVSGDAGTVRALALTLAWAPSRTCACSRSKTSSRPARRSTTSWPCATVRYGIFRRKFWYGALGLGGLAPFVGVWLASLFGFTLILLVPAALFALIGASGVGIHLGRSRDKRYQIHDV